MILECRDAFVRMADSHACGCVAGDGAYVAPRPAPADDVARGRGPRVSGHESLQQRIEPPLRVRESERCGQIRVPDAAPRALHFPAPSGDRQRVVDPYLRILDAAILAECAI